MSLLVSALFALGFTSLIAYLLFELFRGVDPAGIRQYVTCAGGWNEARLNGCATGLSIVPQQPVNSYTNLAYLAGGAFVALHLLTGPALIVGIAGLYLCLSSALYHGTSTRWAGLLDTSAQFALFGALATFSVTAWLSIGGAWQIVLMVAVAVFSGLALRKRFRRRIIPVLAVFLALIYGAAILALRQGADPGAIPFLIASFVVFAVAFLVWTLDRAGTFPAPRWGHGLWHIFTATAIALVFFGLHRL